MPSTFAYAKVTLSSISSGTIAVSLLMILITYDVSNLDSDQSPPQPTCAASGLRPPEDLCRGDFLPDPLPSLECPPVEELEGVLRSGEWRVGDVVIPGGGLVPYLTPYPNSRNGAGLTESVGSFFLFSLLLLVAILVHDLSLMRHGTIDFLRVVDVVPAGVIDVHRHATAHPRTWSSFLWGLLWAVLVIGVWPVYQLFVFLWQPVRASRLAIFTYFCALAVWSAVVLVLAVTWAANGLEVFGQTMDSAFSAEFTCLCTCNYKLDTRSQLQVMAFSIIVFVGCFGNAKTMTQFSAPFLISVRYAVPFATAVSHNDANPAARIFADYNEPHWSHLGGFDSPELKPIYAEHPN